MIDDSNWQGHAARMVDQLGPLPPAIDRAMRTVPRHRFLPRGLWDSAYEDEPLPLPYGEATISAPHMVALQLEWARLAPGQQLMEIGSGSGYLAALAAVLIRPGGHLVGIEIDPGLVRLSRAVLAELRTPEVEIREGDGAKGAPDRAPFDRIIVSCATATIAPAWKEQLAPTGSVVAPLGGPSEQILVRWHRQNGGGALEEGPACRFVPLRSGARRHI